MDFVVIFILLISAILGARKGLALTLVSFMQWFVCVVLGLLFCKQVKGLLMEHTGLDEMLTNTISSHIETSLQSSAPYQAMPDLFSDWINKGTAAATYGAAAALADVILFILSFLLIVLGIKLIGFIIVHLLSKRYNDGVTGFFDGLFGFAFGVVRGIILVLLFFTVLVPVLSVVIPSLAEPLTAAMQGTYLSELLYQDNFLLILIRDIFS